MIVDRLAKFRHFVLACDAICQMTVHHLPVGAGEVVVQQTQQGCLIGMR
jgi:hypothetical protein